jgi:transmembrane sensor
MKNIIAFPSTRRLREEASYWLVSLDEGLTPAEKVEIEKWLRADPAHARALVEQARVWDELGSLSELAGIYPLENYRTAAPRRLRNVAVAASLAIAMLASVWIAGSTFREVEPTANLPVETQPTREYQTAVGEQLSARLPDGSVVSINTDTELAIRFSPTERLVHLRRGEALFDVAHDAERPFRVAAGERLFEALGTVFNVQRDPRGELHLVVTEGRVRIQRTAPEDTGISGPSANALPASENVTILAGHSVSIADTKQEVRALSAVDIEARLSWKRGMLVFRGEPLAEVLHEVERYTAMRFVLKDAAVAAVPVGGYFRTGDVEGVLLALRETFGIETRQITATQIELSLR